MTDQDQIVVEHNTEKWLAAVVDFVNEKLDFDYAYGKNVTLDFNDIDGTVLWQILDFASTKAKAFDGVDDNWMSFVTANPHQPFIFSMTLFVQGVGVTDGW